MRKQLDKTGNEFKTYSDVFDEFTLRNVFKLSSQDYFVDGSLSPLFIGKESNVFIAKNKEGKKVIVKIYRLSTCDFNQMYNYIKLDERYAALKKQKRKVIFAWAQREFRNLLKAREAGVRVPIAHTCLFNIIVMEFIGHEGAAKKLKDLEPENKKRFYDETLKNMKKLHKAGLVHGDLSSFNILNLDDKPIFIDFSQCTVTKSSNAEELLNRDISNVGNYFNKIGFKVNKEEMKEFITGE